MASTMDIVLNKTNKVYKEGEFVAGVVVVDTRSDFAHQGLTLSLDGIIDFHVSPKSVGAFDAFYNSVKPIHLINVSAELVKPGGKFPSGKTEVPFEISLKSRSGKKLYETYHGVYISVQYKLKVLLKRTMFSKDMEKQIEFFVEYKPDDQPSEKAVDKPVEFSITPDSLRASEDKRADINQIPRFKVIGQVDTVDCLLQKPFKGKLVVEFCDIPIRSIELQLLRVELCGCAEGYAKDATEIQNIQIADGDICRGIAIPIHMVFPRLFTCPSIQTPNFKLEFEVNVVLVLDNNHMVMHPIPIRLSRF